MKTIHPLPDHIVAHIAAGEIIERPAYAVKELIDNAIDAKAQTISIELIDSGMTHLSVSDDGTGMNKEDILESYKIHTTSKIKETDDLFSIPTLGFRGEALASIAAVSGLTIESKTQNETAGTKIEIEKGLLKKTTSLGMPAGTRIIARHLFTDIPARKKFIKTKRTEFRHSVDIITSYALAHPNIHIRLSHDGRSVLNLGSSTSVKERIIELFDQVVWNNLIPITFQDSYLTIKGWIGTPQLSHLTSPKQFISVNKRPVTDKLLLLAIKEAFGILLEHDIAPSFFIELTVPYQTVDVNIHPRKEIVQFVDERFIFDAVKSSVTESLTKHNITFHAVPTTSASLTRSPIGQTLKQQVSNWNKTLLTKRTEEGCIQIEHLYIGTPTDEGLLLIDQHAAHERILYEQFLNAFSSEQQKNHYYSPSPPFLLTLSQSDIPLFEEIISELETMGFQIESFHGSSYQIIRMPNIFKERDIASLIQELLHHRHETSFVPTIDSATKQMLAYLSCRMAVKAGDPLTQQQMKDIIAELNKLPSAITCPHGRPLKIIFSLGELNKMFKR